MPDRPIKVIKRKDIPQLKHNSKLGEIKLTRWKKISVTETRKEWLADHEEEQKTERELYDRLTDRNTESSAG